MISRDDGTRPTVTVVVMAYNEMETVEATVLEIVDALKAIEGRHELIVVDDGGTDGTGAIADRMASTIPWIRVIHHHPNAGLGGVYRTGFAEARGEFLTFFPADGQFPATIIHAFRDAITDVDFVLGYLRDQRMGWFGRLMSTTERGLYSVLFGRFPRFQGIFMCRTAALRTLPLRSTGRGWAVVMELLLRADRAGLLMVSRPTTIRPRTAGRSKVHNFRTIVSNTRQMLALRRLL
jgi:glycosyltransferase involved in cell wall biosynthesis